MASQAVTQAVTQAQSRLHGVEAKGGKDRLRLLSAMLDNLVPPGLENVAADINGCRDEAELRQLADHFITAVFKPIKAAGGSTEPPSPSPITAAENNETYAVSESLDSCQQPISTRTAEKICLPRDAYRCIISGFIHEEAPENLIPANYNRYRLTQTQTYHIVPLALAQYHDTDQARLSASRIWASLRRMFPALGGIADNLPDIDHPSNLCTADSAVHGAFGDFRLALEPLPPLTQNRYRVHCWHGVGVVAYVLPQNGIVQLENHSKGKETPMPNPELFRVHFIVTKILRATGLAEVLDGRFDDDYYSPGGLASDGSTNIPYFIEVP